METKLECKFDVTITTDGSCKNNPGPGGWAAIVRYKDKKKELSGYCPEATNNKMELRAVIEGIKALKFPCNVTVRSDSTYVINTFQRLDTIKGNNWKLKTGKAISNKELWEELDSLRPYHNFQLVKVKGHSNDAANNRCDALARQAIADHEKELQTVIGSLQKYLEGVNL